MPVRVGMKGFWCGMRGLLCNETTKPYAQHERRLWDIDCSSFDYVGETIVLGDIHTASYATENKDAQ